MRARIVCSVLLDTQSETLDDAARQYAFNMHIIHVHTTSEFSLQTDSVCRDLCMCEGACVLKCFKEMQEGTQL